MLRHNPVFNEKKLKVTYLGRVQQIRGVDAQKYLQTAAKYFSNGENWEYLTELDHFQALDYIRNNSDALVVIPSPVDNSPYTVIECLQMNLNLIAANTGGIPELVGSSKRLFSPDVKSLADKILEMQAGKIPILTTKSYNREKSEQKWEKFIQKITETKAVKLNKKISQSRKSIPKISITVSHYNLGRYLPDALDTLQKQTYGNYEVIVVDDGSTEKESIDIFKEQREKYKSNSDRWKFFKQEENKGLGHTRNFGAQQADGQYLVFFDADNLAEDFMLESMLESIDYSKVDCLSCFYPAFVENYQSDEDYTCCFIPFGACKEFGTFENLFGDANFIIRRKVFTELGGFTEDPLTATHDWQFLAKLIIEGYELDVIPKFLFKYRIRKDSMINTLDNKHSILSSIDPYTHDFGPREKKLTLMATALDREYRGKKHLLELTEDKIRWMQNSISSHQGQLDSYSKQTRNFSKQVKNLHKEKKSLYTRLDEFCKQNRSLNTNLNESRVNINNLHSDINKLNVKVNSLNSKINSLSSVNSTLNTQLETARTDIKSLNTQLETARTDIKSLNTQLETARTDIKNLYANISDLNSEINSLSSVNSTLNTQLETARTDTKSLNTQLETARTDIKSLNTQLETARTDIKNLYANISDLNSEINSLNHKINSRDSEIYSLNLRLDYTKAELFEARDSANRLSADEFYRVGKFFRNIYKKIKQSFN